jgi:uncharacterized membrane protein
MENTGFKGLLVTLYQRIVLSYKTTLIGIGVAAAGAVVDYYASSPNKVVSVICGLVATVLVFIKEKYPTPVLPPKAP